jgi:hypothetical protein
LKEIVVAINVIDLVKISIIDCQDILVKINFWLALLVIIIIGIIFCLRQNKRILGYCEFDGAELGIGASKIKLKTNQEDIQIAYKLWVELSTRKIGLPIDYENDVIVEIYKSWYDFFGITRELIKSIPATKVRQCDSTKDLVNIAISVLNFCLREHLTLWQAKFRHWYDNEVNKSENIGVDPQVLQRNFDKYEELVESMKEVNEKLIKYREMLRSIIFDNK